MVKIIRMENLDCANCAAKMERKIAALEGVNSVTISFMAQKMILDMQDDKADTVLAAAVRAVKSVDSDCELKI